MSAVTRYLGTAFVILGLCATPARAANPSMSEDFKRMMGWISHELAQGLAFSAGSKFDPPREVKSRRLQPDLSLGVGSMYLDKSKFPTADTQALRDMDTDSIFSSRINFPNLVLHLRAGLPGRSDISFRVANMTTPPGYKLNSRTAAKGQSNSIGIGIRKHFFGQGRRPQLTLGSNFNHVRGQFEIQTKFAIEDVQGFSADNDVNGIFQWNVNSLGLNAVLSQTFGKWTPFFGLGYNYTTGSVRARLEVDSQTPLIAPIRGEASSKPETSQGRYIFGTQWDVSWASIFFNGEVQAIGQNRGKTFVFHSGVTLPFEIGPRGFGRKKNEKKDPRLDPDAPRLAQVREVPIEPKAERKASKRRLRRRPLSRHEAVPELIFLY